MRKFLLLLVVLVVVGAGLVWLLTIPQTITQDALAAYTPNVENGRTMFHAGGCASCHATPKQQDVTRLGGGLALNSPFGTFYVPNISPDRMDGIGGWTEAQFATALLKGTSPAGEHLYPSLPYTSYQRVRIQDVRDLFAFIKTLPPVQGRVRAHDLPFPFSVRRGVGLWKFLYVDGQPFRPDDEKTAEWNRGAYLVNGPGHCAECHSPRDALGGINPGQRFAGGPNPEGEGWVPNITQAALKDWSENDIADLLMTGRTPGGDKVGGIMAPVIREMSQLSPEDRKAMAVYLKSLPPVEGPKPPPSKPVPAAEQK
jgi:mono/diheme cytochrome c family protein